MDNFFDDQRNMECNIREIKNRKCNRITMLRASSCPSCVWMQASPQSTALLRDLALSLYTAHRTSISMERNDLTFEPDPQCNSGSFREVVRQLDLECEASSFKLSGSVLQIMKPLKQYDECGTLITKNYLSSTFVYNFELVNLTP